MKQRKPSIALLVAVFLQFFLMGCNDRQEVRKPVYVPYFNVGDTLYPSYACIDTMIVVDAVGFNKAMGYVEQGIVDASDSQLDSLTHVYCRKIR